MTRKRYRKLGDHSYRLSPMRFKVLHMMLRDDKRIEPLRLTEITSRFWKNRRFNATGGYTQMQVTAMFLGTMEKMGLIVRIPIPPSNSPRPRRYFLLWTPTQLGIQLYVNELTPFATSQKKVHHGYCQDKIQAPEESGNFVSTTEEQHQVPD